MKHQALFSSKDNIKKIKVLSAAILLGALRIRFAYRHIINLHDNTISLIYIKTITVHRCWVCHRDTARFSGVNRYV